ncbi:putative amino acid transporter (Mtr) [Aspergillus saccharolyticus JOP 1030-1]|uniref:Amino acid transporter transmembrane domain-containing protein n=1 Tax=Aspergillus saccharolyticus JOP 1030-1 TaxID=1450539 RepID=A0A318ZH62_9EURO|nr:hypothetical protein BP01DRAFT_364464 [Aspergillus saccharolyticus JOP 1030-1]PYH46901.1 hypothetical protein BP01DRAFT_364464 [Aspergillus saccharolyticus JOP 1030-1]
MSKPLKASGEPGSEVKPELGEVENGDTFAHDDVFGVISEDGPNYRNVGWLGTSILMMKTQIGLGVLSIPSVFDTVGIVPGVILLCVIAGITTWSDYIVGIFKLRHRHVYGIDDVGQLMFGRWGREFLGWAFCLLFVFTAGSAMLSTSIALNAISMHGTCTAVFVAVAAVILFLLSSIRTLGRITWLAWVGVACILTAVFIVTIAVGVQDRPAAAPQEGVWKSNYKVIQSPSFTDAISAINTLVFAYAGTPAFFSIVAEMSEPRHYTKSMILCQSVVTITYITIGVVVYYYCGSYVASPALGSAGPLLKKISYGIALPGLLVSGTLSAHYSSKHIFVRCLRGTRHLTANTAKHWITWIGSTFSVSMIAYVIASGIPIFNTLISLVGALLGTVTCFQPMGCMWLYDNWRNERTTRWYMMVAWSGFVIISGMFLMVAGTYSSIVDIIDSSGSGAWSCADNSSSV